jgi:hypothetical protein
MHERRIGFQRGEDIGQRLEHLVIDDHLCRGLARVELRVGDDDREEVGDTAGQLPFGDEDRLVRIVEPLAAEPAHVRRGEDAHHAGHGRGVGGMDREDPGARVRGHHHRTVQHAGRAQVFDERFLAERLRKTAEPRGRPADPVARAVVTLVVTVTVAAGECRVARQPELLAEEQVTARLAGVEPAAVVPRFARRLNRIDDAAVAGAPAQMAVERLGDDVAIRRLAVLDERGGAHHDAGNAEAALHAAFEHERFRQDAAHVAGHALERDHAAPGHLLRLAQAGERRRAVDLHETAAAGPFGRTAVLRRQHAALLAQHLEQVHARFVRRVGGLAVEREVECGHSRSSGLERTSRGTRVAAGDRNHSVFALPAQRDRDGIIRRANDRRARRHGRTRT